MKKTKEELLIELTRIKKTQEGWVSGDLERRKEFSRAFGWTKEKRQFDYGDAETYEPTWVEIFIELGKLLNSESKRTEISCDKNDIKPYF